MTTKGSLWIASILSLLFFSACSHDTDRQTVDRLNDISYAYHYRNIDSAEVKASQAYEMAAKYGDGRAEALNNLAFVDIIRMDYDRAAERLREVEQHTNNCVELLVAAVQQMRLCQRMSHNREFYDYQEEADRLLRRINEERGVLTERLKRRMVYAESEYAIVASTYYYYVGLERQSREALGRIDPNGEIRNDTAQFLNYLYNVGAGGIVVASTHEEVRRQEFEALLDCFYAARQRNYPFFAANALEAMAEHLLDSSEREQLIEEYGPAIEFIVPGDSDAEMLAGRMADTSLMLFKQYGDVYQTAGAHRTLASCFTAIDDYESALFHLEEALSDTAIGRAPELVASIREKLSVAYSAIDDKTASDYNRNIYLDLQEQTRQDRSLEARADMLDRASLQLNVMIAAVVGAILLLLFLLWLFSHKYHQQRKENNVDELLVPLHKWQEENRRQAEAVKQRHEETEEKLAMSEARRGELERRNMDNRAKVALANGALPLIDRMLNEVTMLTKRQEPNETRAARYTYIAELTDQINNHNDVLTHWIQLRQGMLSLRIESFPLAPLFDIVAKGRIGFKMKGVELRVGKTEATVKADRVLTLFMINTLADNAQKFTDSGGSVSISATERNGYVEVSVADTGRGLSADELATVFSRDVSGGHGFGLRNCRDIIEKYRKTSRLFSSCLLSAESQPGRGSRFYFRLPQGVAKLAVLLCVFASTVGVFGGNAMRNRQSDLALAASYADSAYFSNIAGTYARTLHFADSCRKYLNRHYLRNHDGSRTLMLAKGNTALMPPEVKWYHDSVANNYEVILDIRNESAVAALALHQWALYEYNNKVYTQLFKELSADNTLSEYCRVMQQSQANKTVAVTICLLVLLLILPAYYVLYYRHRLYFRFCVERIEAINATLLSDIQPEEKLARIEPCLAEDYPDKLKSVVERIVAALREAVEAHKHNAIDLEMVEDELNRSEHEGNNLYVCNAVLDNCLSALKHETMYYPSRIRQMVDSDSRNEEDLMEITAYYRDLCSQLGRQAQRQLESVPIKMALVKASEIVANAPADVTIIGNRGLLRYMFDLLRRQDKGATIELAVPNGDAQRYVAFDVNIRNTATERNLFVPSEQNIPFLICRQIVREHSEATDRRACGIVAEADGDMTKIRITLPRKA